MWVRTQDKQALVNVDDFYIHSRNKGFCIVAGRGFDLGVYTYKEQAEKVLNKIHKHICKIESFKIINNYQEINDFIFQMPKNEEV